MTGQRVGYKRVSTVDQSTNRQLDGVDLDRVFEDKVSGKSTDRPALIKMLEHVREGDEVVIHSMDRLARNLRDMLELIERLTSSGVKVRFVKENITLTGDDNKLDKLMLQMMGAFAEFERSLIRERQREGIALAKAKGVYRGRKPKLNPALEADIRRAVDSGTNKAEVARQFGLSRATVYKVIGAQK